MGTQTFKPTTVQINWLTKNGLSFSERDISAHIRVNNPKSRWEWIQATFTNDGRIAITGTYSPDYCNGDHVDRYTKVCEVLTACDAVKHLLSQRA